MISKKAIIVEIVGLFETGKSHFCSTISTSGMVDLSVRGESDVIFLKNRTEKELDELYLHPDSLSEIIRYIRNLPSDITTVCFDGSANLMELVETDWCKEKDRKSALQIEYAELYSRLRDKIIQPLIQKPCNIVMTSGLKEEYIGGVDEKGRATSVKTGKKVRQGIKPMEYIADVQINLYYDDNGMRANRILKNRFVARTLLKDDKQTENPNYIKVLKPEASWKTLIDAICTEGSAMKREWIV